MMYKAVIFDLDGTLLDTLVDLYNSVNHALRTFGFPERTIDEVRRFIGNGVKKLMERSTPEGTDEETNAKCLDCFRAHYLVHMADNTAPYDGVNELIAKLREKGVRTAVVSNKLHSAVVDLCKDYFEGIEEAIGVSVEAERKPNPVNVLKVLDAFGITADECIYVGDSEVDVQTAHNAGVKCIGVTWGFRDEAELKENGADFIAHTAEEVYNLI
ncbi:MAG: HAD family hydrolase [Clostridia bacterium]|nr:HAD family hydrolase [Clostridia bacterium]